MNKDRKAVVEKATEYILHKSSIAQSIKVLYLEAEASMLQLMRVKNRIDSVFRSAGATTKESPELGALKNFYDSVKRASYFFEGFISKLITDATYGVNEGSGRVASFDRWHYDANSLARFTLLFLDRTCRNPEQTREVFELLEGMESQGLFTQEDFEYFEL